MPQHGFMARLPAVLGTDHLPLAELCAARLDGELFAIDDGWAPIDEPDLPAFRAAVTALRVPRALIIERGSAAWVHGAVDAPPAIAQFCVPLTARIAVLPERRATVREVRIDDDEVIRFGGARCTSVVRTAFDLLRDPGLDDDMAVEVTAALLMPRRAVVDELAAKLEGAFRMPYRAAALARLGRVEGRLRSPRTAAGMGDRSATQPSLTR
jgi:hypothetical protein